MAISRCNKCGTIAEHERALVGSPSNCLECAASIQIYDTLFFVNKLSEMYFAQRKELNSFRTTTPKISGAIESGNLSESFDIHNSDILSSELQHKPIIQWFKTKNIEVVTNVSSVDTTGFFDEAAIMIGSNYTLFGEICKRIQYAQQKEYNSVTIQFDKKSKDEEIALVSFIRQLHEHSLFSRTIRNKSDASIRIVLQKAASVRRFFAGEWLEWYVLIVSLKLCQERKVKFSCARNMSLTFSNDEKRELDVFLLINSSQPVYIECKSGDFRQDLDKYVAMAKRLGISHKHFILCVADLQIEQARGLSAMYGLTFVNIQTLDQHLLSLI